LNYIRLKRQSIGRGATLHLHGLCTHITGDLEKKKARRWAKSGRSHSSRRGYSKGGEEEKKAVVTVVPKIVWVTVCHARGGVKGKVLSVLQPLSGFPTPGIKKRGGRYLRRCLKRYICITLQLAKGEEAPLDG